MPSMTYPVHVEARLDPQVSRGLWLVKWLLAIPHYIVLAFLWIAFVVLSIGAFFAILVTGRYPRGIFDFNVGVLRWHWRVAYYAYGALGTDRYPPFTLRDVPDYPARLEVDYPEHLSRGLVLVKWWLLAIPHYLVVGLLLGGAWYAVGEAGSGSDEVWATGLIPLLVMVAAVVLLFTGRYPQALFDLVLGLNRWVLRVAGYAALMTDTYPPFRLDQGGDDPALHRDADSAPPLPPAAGPPAAGPPAAPPAGGAPAPLPARTPGSGPARGWTTGRILSLVAGCLLGLGAVGVGLGGLALVVADQTARDDGFLTTPSETFVSGSYAIVSEDLDMHADSASDVAPDVFIGDARLTAAGAGDRDVFVGLGRADDVRRFLSGVEHATVTDVVDGRPVLRTDGGGAPAGRPGAQDFWVEQASGPGTQAITWTPEGGRWAVLVMNADASSGVDVTVTAGAEVPALPWVIAVLLTTAGVMLLIAVPLVVVPVQAVSREPARPGPGTNVPADR